MRRKAVEFGLHPAIPLRTTTKPMQLDTKYESGGLFYTRSVACDRFVYPPRVKAAPERNEDFVAGVWEKTTHRWWLCWLFCFVFVVGMTLPCAFGSISALAFFETSMFCRVLRQHRIFEGSVNVLPSIILLLTTMLLSVLKRHNVFERNNTIIGEKEAPTKVLETPRPYSGAHKPTRVGG